MDSNEMGQNGNNSDDISSEPSVSLNSYTKGVYGDPEESPCVGSQYQAEIPPLMSISEYKSYTKNPLDEENKGGPRDFAMGLPISIIWVNQEVRPNKDKKVEFLSDSKRSKRCSVHNLESAVDELEKKMDEIDGFLVPGSSGDSWSETEKASLLLGLYIFKKNFVQVKKVVETKNMEEILFWYYGKFYQTAEKRRWSGCRRGKTRKCVLGKKLFEGLRQQELLSRLTRGIPEELQNALMQVSKNFNNEKIELEDYVFSLKNLVGVTSLIDAVGIGRGRQDLTGGSIPICPEVPIGKACSSLRPKEIIKILTGDYRLSKARSTDLFWEAVWPILVNKGWKKTGSSSHNIGSSSKQSHVFFAPGVPISSSRRRLVKGEQYFDSIADVLNLIASNPSILDLDKKEDEGMERNEVEDGNDDSLERRCHRYLQPRTPSRSPGSMSFTVVDTSLSNGKPYELRDLKDLPEEVSRKLASISQSTNESDCAYAMPVEEDNGNVKKLTRSRSENGTFVKRKDLEVETLQDHGNGSKNPNAGNAHTAHVGKRRKRLTTACTKEASGQGVVNLTGPSSDTPEISENVRSQLKLSATSSMESFEERAQVKKPNDRPLFDLNLPAEEEVDFDCIDFLTEVVEPQNGPTEHAEPELGNTEEEQVNLNSRRHSLRNRPPTTRALEAIAHGFLSVNSRKGRGSGVGTRDDANGTSSNISGNGEI